MKSLFSFIFKLLTKKKPYRTRGCDAFGCGHFGASRGDRAHEGLDLAFNPREPVHTQFAGTVTRINGQAYRSDPFYKIVDVKLSKSTTIRFFYVNPSVKVGQKVSINDIIGTAQDISAKHGDGMTNHVHFAYRVNGVYIDPEPYLVLEE